MLFWDAVAVARSGRVGCGEESQARVGTGGVNDAKGLIVRGYELGVAILETCKCGGVARSGVEWVFIWLI
jgi:hypothetical protein